MLVFLSLAIFSVAFLSSTINRFQAWKHGTKSSSWSIAACDGLNAMREKTEEGPEFSIGDGAYDASCRMRQSLAFPVKASSV